MSKLKKVFTLQELLQASRAIAQKKIAGEKDFSAYAVELEQLAFYLYLNQEAIIDHIDEVILQLEAIIKTEDEYVFEFSQYVSPSLLRYWEDQARLAAAEEEEIELLIKQRIAAWIAGLKKLYQLPKEKLTTEELKKVLALLWVVYQKLEKVVSKENLQVLRSLNPLITTLSEMVAVHLPDIPEVKRVEAAKAVAQGTAREIQSLLAEVKTEDDFRQALETILPRELKKQPDTLTHYSKFEENLPTIYDHLVPFFEKSVAPAVKPTVQLKEKLSQIESISATNLTLEEPPKEIKELLTPEPGRTIKDEWAELKGWFYTRGYPAEMIVRLIKSDPSVFKGSAKSIIKTLKETFFPGMTLREQFLNLFGRGFKALYFTNWELAIHSWFEYVGKEKFQEEFKQYGVKRPEDWHKIPFEKAMEIKEKLEEELTAVEAGVKDVSFREREKLLTYNRLFEYVKMLEEFQETHPHLASVLQRFGWLYSWPVRHPHAMLVWQLRKLGPFAPRLAMEFYAGWALKTVFRAGLVKATQKYGWGWESKYVPLVGHKIVWKPTEAAKRWVKEKLSRATQAVLKKLGLEGLATKLVSVLSGWGMAISLMWGEVKKAAKALFTGFIVVLLTLGKKVAAGFAIGAGVGVIGGGIIGFKAGALVGAKLGGTIGATLGGPIGAIAGGIVGGLLGAVTGAILAYLVEKTGISISGAIQSLTAPAAAAPAAEAVGAGAVTMIPLNTASLIAGATPLVIGTLAVGTIIITSAAFFIPVEQAEYGSRYIQIQKGFDINGKAQNTTIFKNEEIIGKKFKYGIKVTISGQTLTNVAINDKMEIIKENEIIEYRNETWNQENTPELAEMNPGETWETTYEFTPDDRFRDSLLSNTVTVTSNEGETQTLTLTLTIGKAPFSGAVALTRKVVDILLACSGLPKGGNNGVVVNRSTWPIVRQCLEDSDLEASTKNFIIDMFSGCVQSFNDLQCVCFLQGTTLGDLKGKDPAKKYCSETTPGYTRTPCREDQDCWNNIQIGDMIVSDASTTGHIAMVVKPPSKNTSGKLLYVEVAEAIGASGVVEYRPVDAVVLESRYCGYLRKGG